VLGRTFPENLILSQLLNTILPVYGTWEFIAISTRALQRSLFRTRPIIYSPI